MNLKDVLKKLNECDLLEININAVIQVLGGEYYFSIPVLTENGEIELDKLYFKLDLKYIDNIAISNDYKVIYLPKIVNCNALLNELRSLVKLSIKHNIDLTDAENSIIKQLKEKYPNSLFFETAINNILALKECKYTC